MSRGRRAQTTASARAALDAALLRYEIVVARNVRGRVTSTGTVMPDDDEVEAAVVAAVNAAVDDWVDSLPDPLPAPPRPRPRPRAA